MSGMPPWVFCIIGMTIGAALFAAGIFVERASQ